MLPSSTWRASTAVPVEVSYNRDRDPAAAFRAEVVYISKDEWRQELDSLYDGMLRASLGHVHRNLTFVDVKAADSGGEGDDGEDDSERKDRMNKALDKIKYVYPSIRSFAKLKSTSPEVCINSSPLFGSQCLLWHSRRVFPRINVPRITSYDVFEA